MKVFFDFLPVLLFFVAYKAFDIYVATGVAVAAAAIQTGAYWIRYRRVERMNVIVLILLVVLGALTLVLRDPVFIKWKPTLVNWAFGAAFLVSEFVGERNLLARMLGEQITLPRQIWRRLNAAWILFFVALGGINIYVAYGFSEDAWVNFKLFGMLGLTFLFVLGQGFYLARYMPDEKQEGSREES